WPRPRRCRTPPSARRRWANRRRPRCWPMRWNATCTGTDESIGTITREEGPMSGRNAWCKVTVALWGAAWLVAACSGPGEDAAADGRPDVRSTAGGVVQASQAKAYPDCEAVRRDAGVF